METLSRNTSKVFAVPSMISFLGRKTQDFCFFAKFHEWGAMKAGLFIFASSDNGEKKIRPKPSGSKSPRRCLLQHECATRNTNWSFGLALVIYDCSPLSWGRRLIGERITSVCRSRASLAFTFAFFFHSDGASLLFADLVGNGGRGIQHYT